jgi:Flp pilus assembly pilin Flp
MEHKYLVYGGLFLIALILIGAVIVYFGTPGGGFVGKFTTVEYAEASVLITTGELAEVSQVGEDASDTFEDVNPELDDTS